MIMQRKISTLLKARQLKLFLINMPESCLRALPAVAALTALPSHADRKLAKAIGRQPTAHASGGAFALGLTGE